MKLRKFDDHLYEMLSDPEFAVHYVEAALQDGGIGEFLYALQEVAVAQGGVQKVAEESQRGVKACTNLCPSKAIPVSKRSTTFCTRWECGSLWLAPKMCPRQRAKRPRVLFMA